MAVLGSFRSRITFTELAEGPNRVFHTLYYRHYLIQLAREKEAKKKEQNGNKGGSGMPTNISDDEFMEEMEDLMEDGGM